MIFGRIPEILFASLSSSWVAFGQHNCRMNSSNNYATSIDQSEIITVHSAEFRLNQTSA